VPQDAFGNDISARTNVLDLAAHYPYSPERWRLFADGSRIFPEYASNIDALSQYTHNEDTHDLSPAAGETVTLESAERPRYVVAYELAVTWAFEVNQSLTGNDRIRIGAYDGTDGWYIEHRGDHPDDRTCDAVLERDGSEVYRETGGDLRQAVTTFARAKLQTGWYDITRQDWERSYTNNGEQENATITTASADDARGSRTGNLPVHFSVTADASTTGLVLSAGSAAQVNLGRTTPLTRSKAPEPFVDTIGSTGTWVPIRAIRVDPDRNIVNAQTKELSVLRYSSDALVTVAINAAPASKVSFGGSDSWSTPPPLTPSSSILETRSDVDTIVDRDGSTVSTTAEPGPFNLNTAVLTPTGDQFQKGSSSDPSSQKRTLPRDDIAVVLAKSSSTGDVTYTLGDEEDW
jgi:hypothetical protein